MESRQRVVADGIVVEQQVRHYQVQDYEDVSDDFICEWLLRRFQGQPIIQATRTMLYEYVMRQIGPMQKYPSCAAAARTLGVQRGTLAVFKCRELPDRR